MDETSYKSPSSLVHDWLKEIIAAELPGSILFEAENHDSSEQKIHKDKGIYVSNSEWEFAPRSGVEASVFDALVIISFYYRVAGTDKAERRAEARDKVGAMAQRIASKIFADMSLGNRFCDCLLLRAVDGSKSIKSDFYAIINQPIIFNPSGAKIDYSLGEAK